MNRPESENMKAALYCLVVLPCILFVSSVLASGPGDVVKNFRLLDQYGKAHELYKLSDAKAVVLMIQGNGCSIVRQAIPALADIRSRYQERNVTFWLINPNLQDDRDAIRREAEEFNFGFPILVDNRQLAGEALGVRRTAEVFVVDPKHWKVVYRGPIDDRLFYGEQRRAAQHHYLTDALDAVLSGRPVVEPAVAGIGCMVNFPNRG